MSELTKEEREKEFKILRDKIADVLSTPYHIGSHPPPTPEEIQSRNKAFIIMLDELKKTDESMKQSSIKLSSN